MFETFSPAWYLLVGATIASVCVSVGWLWYRGPRWMAEQSNFTEPQITEDETRKRSIFSQILGMPAVAVGLGAALVAFVSGMQTYRESLKSSSRQDDLREVALDNSFSTLFKDAVGLLTNEERSLHIAGALALKQLLSSLQLSRGLPSRQREERSQMILAALQADVSERLSRERSGADFCASDAAVTSDRLLLYRRGSDAEPDTRVPGKVLSPELSASLTALASRDAERNYGLVLRCGRFIGAYLESAKIIASDVTGADLSGADLYDANFHDSFMVAARFDGANLTAAVLTQETTKPRLSGASFCPAINYATYDLKQSRLPVPTQMGGVRMQSACGDHVGFAGALIENADLSSTQFEDVNFNRANLRHTDLRNASIANATFVAADLSEAVLSPLGDAADFDADTAVQLWDVSFADATMRRATLARVQLKGVSFAGADLTDATLAGARIEGEIVLAGAILNRTDLRGVRLRGEPLDARALREAGALLCETRLDDGAVHDEDCASPALFKQTGPGRGVADEPCRPAGQADLDAGRLGKECRLQRQLRSCFSSFRSTAPPRVLDPDWACNRSLGP